MSMQISASGSGSVALQHEWAFEDLLGYVSKWDVHCSERQCMTAPTLAAYATLAPPPRIAGPCAPEQV